MTQPKDTATLPVERIAAAIVVLRDQRVLLDSDLAKIFEVETKRLNQQVTRNSRRFPEDFMFRLTAAEVDAVNRLQIATGSQKHRDPRFPPYAFTEHGAIMAANVLNSERAEDMSLYIVRAFIHLRDAAASNKELAAKLVELERRLDSHDSVIVGILKAIRELTNVPVTRAIGFVHLEEKK